LRSMPRLVLLMVALQVPLVAIDLILPFFSPFFEQFGTFDFFAAYMFALFDFILIIGFRSGAKWAWLFGLLFSGLNVVMYVYMYLANPVLLYILPLFLRVSVMFCLRGRAVRDYFDLLGDVSKKTKKPLKK
jgi:hypothetical protein